MITPLHIPSRLSGTKNPFIFCFQSDNSSTNTYVPARYFLDFSEDTQIDEVIVFKWGNSDPMTFNCVASPDDTGTQIKGIASETFEQWMINTAAYLNMNPALSRDFIIEFDHHSEDNRPIIMITAREKGSKYALELDEATTALVTLETIFAPGDETVKENFKIGLQVWCYDPALETYPVSVLVCEINKSPDPYYRHLFNVSDLIKFYKRYYPWVTTYDVVKQLVMHAQPFLIRFWEEWGYPPVKQGIHTSIIHYALDGGFTPESMIKEVGQNSVFTLLDYLTYSKTMLTMSPSVKRTDIETPERLQLIYLSAYAETDLVVKYKIFLTDGSNMTIEYMLEDLAVQIYDVYEISASYVTLMSLLESYHLVKTIKAWEVWAVLNGVDTKHYTFERDFKYYPQVKRFIFHNSLSGYDVIRFTGRSSYEENVERVSVENNSLEIYGGPLMDKTKFSTDHFMEVKANSGVLNKQELEHLREMLTSDEIYEIDKVSNTARKIELLSDKIKIRDDSQYHYSIEISYRYVDPANNFLREDLDRYSEGKFINSLEP